MPQAALNYTQQSENPCKVIPFPKQNFHFTQMESTEETSAFDQMTDEIDNNTHKGMDNFPIEVYNQMIEYSLNHGKIRNAMLMVCMANWGMRFSDVVRVRFGYLFDGNGQFKESFSLPNGEKKTSKQVVYYNNEATKAIISLYLNQHINRHKSRLDFLFVSEGGTKVEDTIRNIEAEDLYNPQIEQVQKEIDKIPDMEQQLLEKYIKGKISDDNYKRMTEVIQQKKNTLLVRLEELTERKNSYVSNTPNADKMLIQKPISHTAGENIIKNTLKVIGINPKNRKDKSTEQTTNDKYNTHSLRKTFADWFIKTGDELNNSGELAFNDTIMDLLKEKFKHSSRSVTTHYTNAQEEAFKLICQKLNIGLDAVENYMYGGN